MPTENLIETTLPAPETEQPAAAPKPAWRAPTLTRIDLKRTMFDGGSNIDGSNGSIPLT